MSARAGGSFATFLMSVPLAAIPLMAIFGIPQFAPVSASPDDEEISLGDPQSARGDRDSFRQRSSDLLEGFDERESVEPLSDAPAYDPFRADAGSARDVTGIGERRRSAAPDGGRLDRTGDPSQSQPFPSTRLRTPAGTEHDWFDAADAAAGNAVAPADSATPHSAAVDVSGRFTETGGSGAGAASRLTWREAARELSDRGIENYRLERGHDAESFLFVCTLTPGDAPQVTMRFEAEAVEPLAAVGNVLDQVDAWLRGRFAAGGEDPAGTDETP